MSPIMAEKKQIGLTTAGNASLAILMEAGLFGTETDAYKVAIAYALAKDLDPAVAPDGGYQTKFNAAGGLDVYNEIRDLIMILRPQDADHPYAAAERLAELGIGALASRIAAQESLGDILHEFVLPPAQREVDEEIIAT
jgi:hypothetical protein